ncbi:hypothetical protein L1987_72624 [Smallanthus sonchifolius]|uniref:Uncharacterized protein n=1 Tax=Smallanthus sonchifolius TaxID=185202 RepID=A0ACB9AVB8_9ASTR|nr:hypothetical protein L1987_72624 [Smallanthus sonchifolius]
MMGGNPQNIIYNFSSPGSIHNIKTSLAKKKRISSGQVSTPAFHDIDIEGFGKAALIWNRKAGKRFNRSSSDNFL